MTIPFNFVVEQLDGLTSTIRPMFGCYALYVRDKIVLILRNRTDHPDDNGVWVAMQPEHHEALKNIFPSMRPARLLGPKSSAWQNIPVTADDFEESVMKACDLIRRNDVRIGKVPKSRKDKRIRKR